MLFAYRVSDIKVFLQHEFSARLFFYFFYFFYKICAPLFLITNALSWGETLIRLKIRVLMAGKVSQGLSRIITAVRVVYGKVYPSKT